MRQVIQLVLAVKAAPQGDYGGGAVEVVVAYAANGEEPGAVCALCARLQAPARACAWLGQKTRGP